MNRGKPIRSVSNLNSSRNETFDRGSLYAESLIRGREQYNILILGLLVLSTLGCDLSARKSDNPGRTPPVAGVPAAVVVASPAVTQERPPGVLPFFTEIAHSVGVNFATTTFAANTEFRNQTAVEWPSATSIMTAGLICFSPTAAAYRSENETIRNQVHSFVIAADSMLALAALMK
jgi:hypothetical protein